MSFGQVFGQVLGQKRWACEARRGSSRYRQGNSMPSRTSSSCIGRKRAIWMVAAGFWRPWLPISWGTSQECVDGMQADWNAAAAVIACIA